GSFNELEQYNLLALQGILEGAAARAAKPGSVEQKVGDFFKSAMDTAAVDAAGLKPVEADLARVAAIASTPELARSLATLHDRGIRSEEHTSELQSRFDLVCRLLLEKKKKTQTRTTHSYVQHPAPHASQNLSSTPA